MKYRILNENHRFQAVYRRGTSYVGPALICYVLRNKHAGQCYYGITSSKKIGCAVHRNRARRVIRAALRQLMPEMKDGYSIVFVARTKTAHVKMGVVLREMKEKLEKAGVLGSEKVVH